MKNNHSTNKFVSLTMVFQLALFSSQTLAWGDKCEDLMAGLQEVDLILSQNVAEANSAHTQTRDTCRSPSLSGCSYASSYFSGLQGNIINLNREKQAIINKLYSLDCNSKASLSRSRGRAVCGRIPPKTDNFNGSPVVIDIRPNPETGKNYMTLEESYSEQCGDR